MLYHKQFKLTVRESRVKDNAIFGVRVYLKAALHRQPYRLIM